MNMTNWQIRLAQLGACAEALAWCKKFNTGPTGFAEAWEACNDQKHAEWMTWLCMRVIDMYGILAPKDRRMICPADDIYNALMKG
jgi:hypothetical protein